MSKWYEIPLGWFSDWYYRIKEMSGSVRENVPMAQHRDPYYITENRKASAEWFMEQWNTLNTETVTHARDFHYVIRDARPRVVKPNGELYGDTIEDDFVLMMEASQAARYLGYYDSEFLDPRSWEDRKNPEPMYLGKYRELEDEVEFSVEMDEWELLIWVRNLSLERTVTGYRYSDMAQDYYLALWCEKSGENSILVPLCEQYHVDYFHLQGQSSVTRALQQLDRITEIGKPARIFYLSDFDKSGDTMPGPHALLARQMIENGTT